MRLSQRFWLAAATVSAFALLTVPSAAQAALPTGTFQTLASSAEPLTDVAVDPTTNLIYAQGNEDTPWYRYSPATDTWTLLAPAPLNSGNNGGAAYLNGKIYTAYTDNNSTLGVYDIASNTWTTIPNPLGEGTGNITAVGGLLYLASEFSFVSYDPATDTTTTLAAVPPFSNATVSDCSSRGFEDWGLLAPFDGKIYGSQGNDCNGFAVYDIASNSWTELPSVPNGTVLGGTADPTTGTIFVYGDYDGNSDGSDHFDRYDVASNSWSTVTFPFDDINDGGMAYVSTPGLEGVYAIEGQDNSGFTRYSTMQDSGVSTSASPTEAFSGSTELLASSVTNGGSAFSPITFTDHVPAGMMIDLAFADSGSCSTSGQMVTCTLAISPRQSDAVNIVVTPSKPGSYTNTVSVTAPNVTDPNSANNTASVTVNAVKGTEPKCIVPKLRRSPLNVAKRTLRLLGCKVGKVKRVYSKSFKQGRVIKSSPKHGTYTAGKRVGLEVSKGRKP